MQMAMVIDNAEMVMTRRLLYEGLPEMCSASRVGCRDIEIGMPFSNSLCCAINMLQSEFYDTKV